MFGKPIQPIGLPDLATLEEHYCVFFHSSTNALSSCVILPVQIMFIRFDSYDIKEEKSRSTGFYNSDRTPSNYAIKDTGQSGLAGQRKNGIGDPRQNNFAVPLIHLFVRKSNSISLPKFTWHDSSKITVPTIPIFFWLSSSN